jgi:hypothetical protein
MRIKDFTSSRGKKVGNWPYFADRSAHHTDMILLACFNIEAPATWSSGYVYSVVNTFRQGYEQCEKFVHIYGGYIEKS